MKRLFRQSRLATRVAVLGLTGLALTGGPTPAAHASSHPTITAAGGDGYLSVGGSGFTPNGTVLVEVRTYNVKTKKWHLEIKSYINAMGPHFVCHTYGGRTICGLDRGGEISTDLTSQPGTVHVVADDLSSGSWSNTAIAYVLPIP